MKAAGDAAAAPYIADCMERFADANATRRSLRLRLAELQANAAAVPMTYHEWKERNRAASALND